MDALWRCCDDRCDLHGERTPLQRAGRLVPHEGSRPTTRAQAPATDEDGAAATQRARHAALERLHRMFVDGQLMVDEYRIGRAAVRHAATCSEIDSALQATEAHPAHGVIVDTRKRVVPIGSLTRARPSPATGGRRRPVFERYLKRQALHRSRSSTMAVIER